MHVHFYEDGNVQAVSTHSVEEVVSAGVSRAPDALSTAHHVLTLILFVRAKARQPKQLWISSRRKRGNIKLCVALFLPPSLCATLQHVAALPTIFTACALRRQMLDGAYVNLKQDHSIMNALRRPLPMDKRQIDFKTLAIAGKMYAGLK